MKRYLIGPSPKTGSPYGDESEKKTGEKQSCYLLIKKKTRVVIKG